jgi:AraC-like DNA-binding protein
LSFYTNNSVINQERHQNQKQIEKISELLHWIDKNYTENINLDVLSDISGLNQKYLCRFFKEYTGRTPIDYINNLRIDAACYEMRHSGLTVTEAALECGFNSISYFTKAFKKYKNMTPTEYKNSKG